MCTYYGAYYIPSKLYHPYITMTSQELRVISKHRWPDSICRLLTKRTSKILIVVLEVSTGDDKIPRHGVSKSKCLFNTNLSCFLDRKTSATTWKKDFRLAFAALHHAVMNQLLCAYRSMISHQHLNALSITMQTNHYLETIKLLQHIKRMIYV